MSVARWIQCEEAITEFGFLAKASDYGQCNPVALCGYEPKLHEPDQPALDGNLSNRKKKIVPLNIAVPHHRMM